MITIKDLLRPLFQSELDAKDLEISGLLTELAGAQNELTILRASKNFLDFRDPTYAEFHYYHEIWSEQIRQYQATTYDCDDFARDYQAIFLQAGLRCNCELTNGNKHVLNSIFIPEKNWIVFIEPQTCRFWTEALID